MNKRELEILKIGFEAGKKAIEMHPDDDEYDTIRFEEAQEEVKNLDIPHVSGSLNSDSEKLLQECFVELKKKMIRNEKKYGYSNEWLTLDWEDECKKELRRHLEKGDPKDVAIYAMFMMHRGWSSNDR